MFTNFISKPYSLFRKLKQCKFCKYQYNNIISSHSVSEFPRIVYLMERRLVHDRTARGSWKPWSSEKKRARCNSSRWGPTAVWIHVSTERSTKLSSWDWLQERRIFWMWRVCRKERTALTKMAKSSKYLASPSKPERWAS